MDKNKKNFYTVVSVAFGIIFIMNISILPFRPVLSLINLLITALMAAIALIFIKYYNDYSLRFSQNIKNIIDNSTENLFNGIPAPVIVLSSGDKPYAVFYNTAFKKDIIGDQYVDSKWINSFLEFNFIQNVLASGSAQISYKGKKYKIHEKKINGLSVLCFSDTTKYRNLKQKYIDSRPCVGFVLFDNKEELRRYATDEQGSQISIALENMLRQWIAKAKGIFKKLSDGKYFIVFEEIYLKEFVENKFKIIDQIHGIKVDEQQCVTVSMGISRGACNLEEAKTDATAALNMSLGRGGDQVTVKNKNSYEFFGGTSQGVEKRSKVRTRMVAKALTQRIESSDCVFIMGHKHSDFDSVGAAAALWSVCTRLKKKKCFIVLEKNESMAGVAISALEKQSSPKIFISPARAQTMITENSLLIIVDTHSLKFIESKELYSAAKNIAVIDHHRMAVDKIDDAVIFFHEPFASSACEMVTELTQYMGDKFLKKSEAECLLAGIMLDTKSFSLKCGIRTFEAAAYLKKRGADNFEVKKMFAETIESYKLRCKIIESVHIVDDCAIAFLDEPHKDARLLCAQSADELLNVKNVKASFVLFESNDKVNISARSLGDVNVQIIMESLGGGGHQTMAAAQIYAADFEQAKQKLIKAIEDKTEGGAKK